MISEKIFELILRNGMTQKEFSEETGISQSTISDWKRKGTNPSADKILKICEVLKVTPYELLGENETTKEVTVKVVDQVGPKIETLGSSEGYVVEVPVKGSNDLASYVKATDDVDGDVTPFMESDKALDTSKLGTQTITLKASDVSGNETEKIILEGFRNLSDRKKERILGYLAALQED